MEPLKETLSFIKSHYTTLPYPTKPFTGQVIIVTGSNIGMGLEAARHFVRLDASKVILAVRNLSKGQSAASSIAASEKKSGVVEVWELDLASYDSVKAFAKKAQTLERLDVVVENAGMYAFDFTMAEEDEMTITVNVVSQFLLGLLLLPKLRETSLHYGKEVVLTFTGSFVHFLTDFPERRSPHIFEELARKQTARVSDRYNVSKLMELLAVRELASEMTKSGKEGDIVVSLVNPGSVRTDIMRHAGPVMAAYVWLVRLFLSRSPEEGGRTLVSAAEGGKETHGQYLNDCKAGQ
jgi:retinol dehydrogenase-12